jgi:hypothetical protein
MNIKSVVRVSVLVGVAFLIASPASAIVTDNLILLHEYSAGSVADLVGSAHGTLGSNATLVQPAGGNLGYVNLPGGSGGGGDHGSHVLIPASGLSGMLGDDGDASIEFWLDIDPICRSGCGNKFGDGDISTSMFMLLNLISPGGSTVDVHHDTRNHDNPPISGSLGWSKDSDIVNAGYGGYDSGNDGAGSNGVASDDLAGLHQYVFTFDGGPGSNGSFTGYKDGAPIVDKTGAPESFDYRSTSANILAAAGGGNWSFGGRHPDKGSRASPVGKAYKFAIYSDVLTANEVAANFSAGLSSTPTIPEPTALSLLSLGSLALLGWRRSR